MKKELLVGGVVLSAIVLTVGAVVTYRKSTYNCDYCGCCYCEGNCDSSVAFCDSDSYCCYPDCMDK